MWIISFGRIVFGYSVINARRAFLHSGFGLGQIGCYMLLRKMRSHDDPHTTIYGARSGLVTARRSLLLHYSSVVNQTPPVRRLWPEDGWGLVYETSINRFASSRREIFCRFDFGFCRQAEGRFYFADRPRARGPMQKDRDLWL